MKKLSAILLSIAALSLFFSCSNAFESITLKQSVKVDVSDFLARTAVSMDGDSAAVLTVTVSSDNMESQTQTVYFSKEECKSLADDRISDKLEFTFKGIPQGKRITVTAEFKLLDSIDVTPDDNFAPYSGRVWKGVSHINTGKENTAEISLTEDIPLTENTIYIIKNSVIADDPDYKTLKDTLEYTGFENGEKVKLIFTDNITVDSPITIPAKGVYYYVDLNGHSLILNYDEKNYAGYDNKFSIMLDNSDNSIVDYGISNLYLFNGSIKTDDTSYQSDNFAHFYLDGYSNGGILAFKNIEFTGLKNQIIKCSGKGSISIVNSSFTDCSINKADSLILTEQVEVTNNGETEYCSVTLSVRDCIFSSCSVKNSNGIIAPYITFKGTASIVNSRFNADYSGNSTDNDSSASSIIKACDTSTLYLEGTSISSKGKAYAIYAEPAASVLLDTNDSLQIRYKPTVIDSENAVYLSASLDGYKNSSYLIASRQAEIKGNVFLDYFTDDLNISDIMGFSKIGTINLSSKIRIKINQIPEIYTICDGGIIHTDYPGIDEPAKVITHIDTSLIERYTVNEDGCLEISQ
jgi:hypothetical protein